MDEEIIYPVSEERYYLEKLSRYLNFHISTSVLFILSLFWGIALIAAVAATVLFLSFMLYVFIRLRKKAWIITFLAFVILPAIACIIFGYMLGYLSSFMLLSLAFFYVYFFILKYVINDYLEELLSRERLQMEREEENQKKLLWQSQFNREDK